ncbi:cellulase family glycosylhydrolase [Paenibacillus sp. FSL W8-0426]|uniref:cellulase family glycosylhydrolase n=1 Tax=Paenibacillus sp. FSL W8-0426 TaxID=2921714 RepID=UPI0030D9F189
MKKIGTCLLLVAMLVSGIGAAASANSLSSLGYYHTSGNRIVDAQGKPANFNGVNWFGFETDNFAPHGLWTRSMDSVLDQLAKEGYNLLRIPYTNEMLLPGKTPSGIDYAKNPDLKGLTPLQLLDKLVQKAGERGMKIILDRHRPTASGQTERWYTPSVPEKTWIKDWKMLAKRYLGNDTVIGADLHNEPHGSVCWGCGDSATDWRLAAERAGNAILAVNPDWLIVVEGVDAKVKGQSGSYWWGGNLKGVRKYPVRLKVANRIVYSPHDYGPGVSSQPWFADRKFPANLSGVWDANWGYIHKEKIAPILLGEFGGRSVDTASKEGKWQNALVDYISRNDLYWTYWSLNPNSGDTGGLLLDDWQTWNKPKQKMLARIMKPVNGGKPAAPKQAADPAPSKKAAEATAPASGGTNAAEGLAVQYKTSNSSAAEDNMIHAAFNITNNGKTDIPLSEVKIRYYFTKDGSKELKFWCDWAQVGTNTVSGTFAPIEPARTGTDGYLEIRFAAMAGSIPAGGQSGDIQVRIAKSDWSDFNPSDDYSFDGTKTSFSDWNKVTLYRKGKLVWGIEP